MGRVSFRLFGRFDVRYNDRPLHGLENMKAQELVSYLLLGTHRPYHREMLADVLWGDMLSAQPRKHLRHALWQVQTALRPTEGQESGSILMIEPDWIRLNDHADVWADVTELSSTMLTVQEVPGRDFTPEHAGMVRSAIDLYTGDLLEGWYQDWCLDERQRLRTAYLILIEKLMDYCEAHQHYESGINCGNRILQIDRSHERTHRSLMRMYYLKGDRTAALRQYQRCRHLLIEDFGIHPSLETDELFSHISALAAPNLVLEEQTISRDITAQLSNVRQKLEQLQVLVGELDDLVQHHSVDTATAMSLPGDDSLPQPHKNAKGRSP